MLGKKVLSIVGGIIVPVALGATMAFAGGTNVKEIANLFAGNEETEYTLTFDASSTKGSFEYSGSLYDYAYTNSTLGNRYGLVGKNTATEDDRKSTDVVILKGTSNFIYFSYGDINTSNNTYTQAAFPGKVKSVSMNCYYEASNDYTLYARVYYSADGTWSDSNRKGYTVTKELTTISFDLSSVSANYIKIGLSNAYSIYHFESISITYGC